MSARDGDTYPWDMPDDVALDREDEMNADAFADSCNLCDGPLVVLGQLGNLVWFRCRNCSMECNRPAPRVDVAPSEDDTESPF